MRVAIVLLVAVAARSEIFEWWQSTDMALFQRGGTTAVVHTQIRFRKRFRDFFQGRIGPVVRTPLGRYTLQAGYYFGESEEGRAIWRNDHRTFAGLERPFAFAAGTLRLRGMAEHHFGGGNPQDRRFRAQIQWAHNSRLSPYWGTETFFDREGYMNQRIQGGVRRRLSEGYWMDIGYLYDVRQFRVGEHRHVIHTSLRPRRRE